MKQNQIVAFFIILTQVVFAQNITGKIIDSKTGESIPYASIQVNHSENLISNTEGYFTLSEKNSTDESVLIVMYLGYVNRQLTVGELKNLNYTIQLNQGIVELNDVKVSNAKLDPYLIMAKVNQNLERNYKIESQPIKELLFIRNSVYFKPTKFDFEIDKSTEMSKKALKSANDDLNTFTSTLIEQPPKDFTDILSNYYTVETKKEDKSILLSKLEVLKATRIRNENRSTSFDELEKKFTNIILKNLDSTKYYRVKSGLIGSRDTISLRKDFNKKNKKIPENQLSASKSALELFMKQNHFLNNSKLSFINQPEWYDYLYEGATYSNENEFVYVLSFTPRKSKAKYTGKIYISEKDYAVLRTDYALAEGKKEFGFNMKFLLGVKVSVNNSKGTIIYKENTLGNGYYLQYASTETGQYFYFNRPIKFIELTKGEKDVVAFDLKIEGSSKVKSEFLNISRSETTKATIENYKEEDFKFINLKTYDPKIWKDYSAIEPLEEMKQYKVAN